MPILLLGMISFGLVVCGSIAVLVIRRDHRGQELLPNPPQCSFAAECPTSEKCFLRRPSCWLAIKSRNLETVKSAFKLQKVKPCSWFQGMAGDERLFIAPPVNGWILVFGSALPDPAEDVDVCFRFIIETSRKLGHIQFFSASRILNHHAWIRAERGRIQRAYAWAGRTLWTQGSATAAEKELKMRCLDYDDGSAVSVYGTHDTSSNSDKVPLLADRWSLDPGSLSYQYLEEQCGVAGVPSCCY